MNSRKTSRRFWSCVWKNIMRCEMSKSKDGIYLSSWFWGYNSEGGRDWWDESTNNANLMASVAHEFGHYVVGEIGICPPIKVSSRKFK